MEESAKGFRLFNVKECFSEEEVNRKRVPEIDIARGLAVLFMVICHVFLALNVKYDILGVLVDDILGGPFSAPVFMFLMGIGMAYSRHTDAKSTLIRGLKLLAIAYILNFVRLTIPSLIAYGISGDHSFIADWLDKLMCVDILQFAGMAFLVIALFKKLKLDWWWLLLFSVALLVVGPFLKDKATNIHWLDLFLALFYKTYYYAYFPLFHWLILPVVGLKVGELYLHLKNKARFYVFSLVVIFPISAAFEVVAYMVGFELLGVATEYYYFTLLSGVSLCGFVMAWISLIGLVLMLFKNPHLGFFTLLSKNVLSIYCIHWVIVFFIHNLFALYWQYDEMPEWQWALFSIGVLAASIGLSIVYTRVKQSLLAKRKAAAE